MKKNILVLLLATVALSSCCTKKYCVELSGFPIKFYGFNSADLDTIYTTGYAPGSNFAQITRPEQADSVRADSDTPTIFLLNARQNGVVAPPNTVGAAFSDQHEWKIYIPSVNKTILISDYGYSTYSCNNCLFDKSDKVRSLSTCSVDGITESAQKIKIHK